MLIMSDIGHDAIVALNNVAMSICSFIYGMVAYAYKIFLVLAVNSPFQYSDYQVIMDRIYVVLGVMMLFILTYELFMLIIDPDGKKDSNPGKLIVNVVLSIVILVLLPTFFAFIGNLQNSFLNTDVLGHIILGTDITNSNTANSTCGSNNSTLENGGNLMASHVFQAFFSPVLGLTESEICIDGVDNCESETNEIVINKLQTWSSTQIGGGNNSINTTDSFVCPITINSNIEGKSLQNANDAVEQYGCFGIYKDFINRTVKDDSTTAQIDFNAFFAIIAGCFLCYVVISFCIDLGIRVVKLAFLQLIAPIPIIMRVIPKTKDVFNNWIKMLISVYLEVFVRIAAMYIGVLFISILADRMKNGTWLQICGSGLIKTLSGALVIMGIVAFIKMLPDMLKKLFPGMDSGGMKLGLKDKLAASGAFAAGAGVGAMATTGVRNFNANKGKGLGKGLVSALAGAGSGFARGVKGGASAKNWADMNKAASAATSAATGKRSARAAYKASHGGNIGGVISGHISDARESINTWAGGSSLDALKQQQAMYDEGTALQNDLFALVDDDKMVMSIVGAKKAEQERVIQKKEIDRGKYGSFQRDGSWKWNGDKAQERYNSDVRNSNLEYANAIQDRTKRLEVLDNAEKLARTKAVDDKLREGIDGRFIAMQKKSETFQKQHSDDNTISGMAGISVMSDEERARVDEALSTFDPDKINSTWTGAKSGDIGYVGDNTKFKTESGKVKTAIAEKIEKVQPASSDNKS